VLYLSGGNIIDVVMSSSKKAGRMLRVKPSMLALEHALSYGSRLQYNTPVQTINDDHLVNGQYFDFIVVATEAKAVNKILHDQFPGLDTFARVQYQPSRMTIHKDERLMPKCKSKWCAFNVCQNEGQSACMLSVWLNEYYPNNKFPENIFETWNPHEEPKDIIKDAHFVRVVHTEHTPSIIRDIDCIQGHNNVFFAGSYTTYGMGLLEQAALSAEKVSKLIKAKSAVGKS
jgi:predicted NAD/FAD-binding protein